MSQLFEANDLAGNVIPFPGVLAKQPVVPPKAKRASTKKIQDLDTRKFKGPLSSDLWTKANSVQSGYEDTFDYAMYDRLFERFKESQPRGGVVFKSTFKLTEAEDCRSCFHRFELDTYGRGCVHNCAYCYAKAYLHQHKFWNEPMPFPVDIADIRKTLATIFETDRPHKLRGVIGRRIPLRIGSMSDSFMWMDKKYRVTYELLKLLKYYRYPYLVFTRSDLVADDEYMAVLDPKLASIQMSISSTNEQLTRLIEPGAPSPKRRLEALQKLQNNGFWTTVRINPLFPIYPDGYFTDPNFDKTRNIKPFPYFSWDMIETIAQHQIPTVLVGVARLYLHNIRFLNKALGYDIREHFLVDTKMERAALHFSPAETAYYYKKIHELCQQHKLRFSTCYIGNDPSGKSFKDFQNLWSNKKDCCDAKGNVPGITKTCADLIVKPAPVVEREIQI